MSNFYKDNTERVEKLKKLLKRMTKKNWAAGSLASTEHNADGTNHYTFCFVGHIARVLTPHFTDSEAAGPTDFRLLQYPIHYKGGKDLMERLARVAWEFYPKQISAGFGDSKRISPRMSFDELTRDYQPMDMLVALNDYMQKGDSPHAGWSRVRRVVRETAKRLEEGTL